MALTAGTRLGAYEILSLIGSGGRVRVNRTYTKLAPEVVPTEWYLLAQDRKRRDVWAGSAPGVA